MPPFIRPSARPVSQRRSLATAALVGTAVFVNLLIAAPSATIAQSSGPSAQVAAPQHPAAAGATETKGETIEQRIKSLHTALKVTPDQDTKWKAVAQAMRQNAVAMDKLIVETQATTARGMTAPDDLNTYKKFAQVHLDGLKNLIDDFKILYDAMPAPQKKNADEVFKTSRE